MATQTFDPALYKSTTRDQWQGAAEAWNRWGPAIQSWLGSATEDMLDLAAIGIGDRVLDVAAGAGEPALSAASRVGPTGYVLATDISSNNLEFARQAAQAQQLEHVETRTMDGENLEVDDDSFDAVLSRVGLIYFPNQERALSEMRRVLKPGGRVAAMVYTIPENNRFFSIPVSINRRRAQLPPPLPGHPGPFSLGGPGVLEDAYRRAGFRQIETRIVQAPVRLSTAAECVQFERESFGALLQMLSGLSDSEQVETWDEIEQELRQFEDPHGFTGPCEMIVGVGVK